MMRSRFSVCIVTTGFQPGTVRLQPWRYLHETACQLAVRGYHISILTDVDAGTSLTQPGLTVRALPSVRNPVWRPNRALLQAIREAAPDVVLWHVGLTSLLHQRLGAIGRPVVGIFTSPIYDLKTLLEIGVNRLIADYPRSTMHVLGSLIPRRLLRRRLQAWAPCSGMVVQTETTRRNLHKHGYPQAKVQVIPPGVDEVWRLDQGAGKAPFRSRFSYASEDVLITYFGSPAAIRGLPTLVKALPLARRQNPSLRLLVLSRRHEGELAAEEREIERLIGRLELDAYVRICSGYLAPEELVTFVKGSDIVCLPFELVLSDAPLSLLEAQAAGKIVVSTRVACLPELINAEGFLAAPNDPQSLADALLCATETVVQRRRAQTKEISGTLQDRPARNWWDVGVDWERYLESLLAKQAGASMLAANRTRRIENL